MIKSLLSALRTGVSDSHNFVQYIATDDPAVGRLQTNATYFRPWIVKFSLTDNYSRPLHNQLFLVVASVRLPFAGPDRVTFTKLVQLTRPGQIGAHLPAPLAPLLPYTGVPIELDVAVLLLRADPRIQASIDSVTEFSDLLFPPLGEKLFLTKVVERAANRMIEVSSATDFLRLSHTWPSASEEGEEGIAPGYFALVRGPRNPLEGMELTVQDDELFIRREDQLTPLVNHDYMLLRVEGQPERGVWEFPRIASRLKNAAYEIDSGNVEAFNTAWREILIEIFQSPDLTEADRRRIALALKEELVSYRQWAQEDGAFKSAARPAVLAKEELAGYVKPPNEADSFKSATQPAASAIVQMSTTDIGSIVAKHNMSSVEVLGMSYLELADRLVPEPQK